MANDPKTKVPDVDPDDLMTLEEAEAQGLDSYADVAEEVTDDYE